MLLKNKSYKPGEIRTLELTPEYIIITLHNGDTVRYRREG